MAFYANYKSSLISSQVEYASHQSNRSRLVDTTATTTKEVFTSDPIFLHDAFNIYSSVHIALALPHAVMGWPLFLFNVLMT